MSNSKPMFRAAVPLLISPSFAFLVAFFILPLLWCFLLSFMSTGSIWEPGVKLTFEHYQRFLGDSYYLKDLLWRTVWLSLLATLCAVAVGYVGAMVIVRAPEHWQGTLLFLVMCPLWVNLVVRTLSLMVLLARDGPVNGWLMWMGWTDKPLKLLFNETAVLIGMIQVTIPFVVISLHGVLKSISKELEYAAMTVGANTVQAFLRVTLPLSVPGIMAGSVLALGLNMESFVVPILLGGGKVHFMSVVAYETATIGNNLPFAATIGIVLLCVTLGLLGFYQMLVRSVGRVAVSVRAA